MSVSRRFPVLFGLLPAFLFATGCGDEKTGPPPPADGTDQILLTLANFPDPSPAYFALWADGSLVFRFSIEGGAPIALDGSALPSVDQSGALGSASTIVITLESDTTAATPSSFAVVAGPVSGSSAELTTSHAGAWNSDLSTPSGTLLLDAPTTADPHDCQHGMWWTDGEGAAALTLPTAPLGWSYEGWVIDREDGDVYSTGRFDSPNGFDSDSAGATSGGDGVGYPFPGQDFAVSEGDVPILDLDDGRYAIKLTLEPEPDFSSSPFPLVLLEKDVSTGAEGEAGTVVFALENLPNLGSSSGARYEAWILFEDDSLLSLGSFWWQAQTMWNPESGKEIQGLPAKCNLVDATHIGISVEPMTSKSSSPSGGYLLAGEIDGEAQTATLSMDHGLAFGAGMLTGTAAYTLTTPSTPDEGDYDDGLWFFSVGDSLGDTTATIVMPDLPSGWQYHTRIFGNIDLDPVSIGTFPSPHGADSDGAGEFAADDSTAVIPSFPGQDFVEQVARLITNGTHSLTIHLEPTNLGTTGDEYLLLFTDERIISSDPGVSQGMEAFLDDLPSSSLGFSAVNRHTMAALPDGLPSATVNFAK